MPPPRKGICLLEPQLTDAGIAPSLFTIAVRYYSLTFANHPYNSCCCALQAYPPHGGIRLLEPQHTDAGRPAIERFVAEDYIIDTMAAFDLDRCL